VGVRYAVGLPTVGEFGDPVLLVELAVLAEKHGWDGVYLWDHVLFHDPTWPVANPTVTAAAVAAATTRVRLIVMHVLPRHRVELVAREAVSLDVLSGGRLTFAAAIGSMDSEFTAFGASADLRVRAAALDAGLDDLRALWSGSPVGPESVRMVPGPRQPTGIPIWCGGRWPNKAPLRRAARFDGVMPTFIDQKSRVVPPEELAEAVSYIAGVRGSLDGFDIAMEGATSPGSSVASYEVGAYERVGLTWWIEAMGWWRGGVAAARTRIAAGPPAI